MKLLGSIWYNIHISGPERSVMGASTRSWFKLNYNGSVQNDEASGRFVARIDVGTLIGAGCCLVATNSLLES